MTVRERALKLLERHIAEGCGAGDAAAATARECLVALEGLGYRPTEARPAADWRIHADKPADGSAAAAEARRLYPNLRHPPKDGAA